MSWWPGLMPGEIELSVTTNFIQEVISPGLVRGLQAELTGHLGYEKTLPRPWHEQFPQRDLPEDGVNGCGRF